MVLPLLFSIGLPALAGSGALGATLGAMSVPALAGIGAGLGSFVQTGDIGKGIQTGMASFLGGKVLGGLSGSTSTNAINAAQGAGAATKPGFIQSITAPSPSASSIVAGDPSNLATKFLGTETANAAMPFGTTPNATKGGALTAAQQGFTPGMIGQTMTDMQLMQQGYENRAADAGDTETRPPLPNPMIRTLNPNPYAGGFGEANYFNYRRMPRPDGSTPQYPYTYADGGIMALAEGGEAEADADAMMEEAGMNEKDVIMNAILAIKEMIVEEEAEMALAMFVMKYGEEALRNLVDKVQSGEFDETVERFAAGEQGMVEGPGDGSGVDDMVPATLEGEQDVLLSDGEFVLRKKTTDALEKAYGGGFLDVVNRAEEDAPKKLEQMVG
tara:strand:+ start:41 stop:1198 length:1158 start_codon:yes stop_codon:yes gene_type:complete